MENGGREESVYKEAGHDIIEGGTERPVAGPQGGTRWPKGGTEEARR